MNKLNSDKKLASDFVKCWEDVADAYPTDNVLITWGHDFSYYNAEPTYGLMQDIVKFVSERSQKLAFRQTTVATYLKDLKSEL